MRKLKATISARRFKTLPLFAAVFLVVGSGVSAAIVHADQYDQKIQTLENQNSQSESNLTSLESQATSYQDAINKLQQRIAGIQNDIAINRAKQAEIQKEIIANQKKLAEEKKMLSADLKAMYVGGKMTTVEMLATSKNLSDFVDAETYDTAVQNKIQDTMNQIMSLENKLKKQQLEVTQLLAIQQQQNDQMSADRDQQQKLLAYNQSQQDAYNAKVANNEKQIAELRAEQIAANQQLVGTGRVNFSGTCGGSYPATAAGPWGHWGCSYPLDNTVDPWGMYNRECVSYTAWMVYRTYGYMPNWGGVGDARQWPGDARAAHIPTGSTPRVNSVAIYMGGASDPWGHAMWVRSVNGDGTITVDQYNLYYDGRFYETTIPAAGLVYIYFGE
jgi:peptidoglycan hydrolase CwlO-like protein/surface antigen